MVFPSEGWLSLLIGISPLPGSLQAAPIAWSRLSGAVAGRKYHCPSVCVTALNLSNIYSLHGH